MVNQKEVQGLEWINPVERISPEGVFILVVSARTNKRHHHHQFSIKTQTAV
jgi:hypothetical protein